jgi:hypothetical protein
MNLSQFKLSGKKRRIAVLVDGGTRVQVNCWLLPSQSQ